MIAAGISDSVLLPIAPAVLKPRSLDKHPSVLIVDDDIAVCKILTRILSDANYEVFSSQSVQDASGVIGQRPFDAYVFDYRLMDGTGLEVAEHLRSTGSAAPVILISGYGSDDLAAMAQPLGISQIVSKPFSQQTICSALEKSIIAVAASIEPLVNIPSEQIPFKERSLYPRQSVIIWITALIILAGFILYFYYLSRR
jgi:DNA-binding NtrC family response regulator